MNGEELYNDWREYSQDYLVRANNEVVFNYHFEDLDLKNQIILALGFWKFLKRNEGSNDSFLLSLARNKGPYNERIKNFWVERKARLSVLMEKFKDYPLIIHILKLESLPTELFQRALWASNIDFMSGESHLRRLTEDNIKAIARIYDEFWEEKRVSKLLNSGCPCYDSLLACDFDEEKRYAKVVRIAHYLFDLDFGFCLFSNGENDDHENPEVGPLRFLQKKNHYNDFGVNPYGKYFKLYKSARSNYVFNSDKEIKMKQSVCPGFWYTLLAHLYFWIISPLLFPLAIILMFQPSSSVLCFGDISRLSSYILFVVTMTLGMYTPAWLFLAGIKYVGKNYFPKILELFERGDDWLNKHDEVKQIIKHWFTKTLLFCLAFALGFAIYHFLVIKIGIVWNWSLFLAINISIFYFIITMKRTIKEKHAKWLQKILYFSGSILIFKLASIATDWVIENWEKVMAYIVIGLEYIWLTIVSLASGLIDMGPIALLLLVPILAAFILFITNKEVQKIEEICDEKKEKAAEEEIDKRLKIVERVMRVVFWLLLIAINMRGYLYSSAINTTWYDLLLMFAAITIGIELWFNGRINPTKKIADIYVKYINKRWGNSETCKFYSSHLLQSSWYRNIPNKKKQEVLRDAAMYFDQYVSGGTSCFYEIFTTFLLKGNAKKLKRLKEAHSIIRSLSFEKRILFITQMIEGKNKRNALRMAEETLEVKEKNKQKIKERKEKIQKVVNKVFAPFRIIKKGFVKIAEYAKTLYRLYELFNKLCPHIADKEKIKI